MMSAEIGPIPETEFTKPRSRFVKLNSIRSSKSKGGEDEKKVFCLLNYFCYKLYNSDNNAEFILCFLENNLCLCSLKCQN